MPAFFHKQPIYVQVNAISATDTVQLSTTTPVPSAHVYDINGLVVSAYDTPTPLVVQVESGVGISKKAYTILDADTPGLVKGFYNVSFLLGYKGSDNIDRTIEVRRNLMLYWTDVPSLVRQTLKLSATDISDNVIDGMFGVLLAQMYCAYSDLPAYNLLSAGDKKPFDNVLAYMIAAMYSSGSVSQSPAGPMVMYQSGTDKVQWANNVDGATAVSDVDRFMGLAIDNLTCISVISTTVNNVFNAPLFVAVGPRRTARESLGFGDTVTPLYDMYRDDRLRWEFSRIQP